MDNTQGYELAGGALQSPADYRYINLASIAGAAPADLSAFPRSFHVDFSGVPDMYQRQIGACTNHSFAEHLTHREQRLNPQTTYVASARFGYALSKIEDGVTPADEQGTYCVMPFKIGVKYGIASTAVVPNDTTIPYDAYIFSRNIHNIPAAAFTDADQHRIPGYVQVGQFGNVQPQDLLHALMQNPQDGVAFCLPLGSEWYTRASGGSSWAKADILPIRKMVSNISGHDVLATGFEIEEGTNRVKIFFRNHWSKAWASTGGIPNNAAPENNDGDNGWFYMDQHTITEAWMTSEIPDALLAIVKSLPAQKDFNHQWLTTIQVGSQGPDVTALQIALKIVGTFPFNQAVTDYFGAITQKAVMDYQRKYHVATEADIVAAAGACGPQTRDGLNRMFAHK